MIFMKAALTSGGAVPEVKVGPSTQYGKEARARNAAVA